MTWPKFATGLRSRPKGWELDHYVFFSWWHIYLMFLISVLPNLEGKKYFFGDVTLTCTVPIWGVLPQGSWGRQEAPGGSWLLLARVWRVPATLPYPDLFENFRVQGSMTASQLNPSYECGEGMKVKVVKWCWKKWNWPILMHIYDKQCEIMQKNQWKSPNIQIQCFYNGTVLKTPKKHKN